MDTLYEWLRLGGAGIFTIFLLLTVWCKDVSRNEGILFTIIAAIGLAAFIASYYAPGSLT